MLRETNIESKMINGKVYGNNHSWNLVNIDGTWPVSYTHLNESCTFM